MFGVHPVLGVVEVDPLVPLGEEGQDPGAGDSSLLHWHPRPRDLEAGILDEHLGEGLVGHAVPRRIHRTTIEQRDDPITMEAPHLAGMLAAQLHSP
jgi:hypothetical protein